MLFQVKDFRLTTAEILYRMPDHPALLQTYVWQKMDLAPGYPELRRFLDFWEANLDGKLHSIRVVTGSSVRRDGVRHANHMTLLH